MVHVPEVVTILGKRIMDKGLDVVWHPVHVHHVNILGEPPAAPSLNVPPPNLAEVNVLEGHAPPPNPADSDCESIDFDDDAPPASPEWSTDSEDLGADECGLVDRVGLGLGPLVNDLECVTLSLGERSLDGVAECSER